MFAIGAVARRPAHAVRLAVPDPRPARGSARRASSRTPRPPRFAQAVGLGFAVVGARRLRSPALDLLGAVATGFALAAAFLNAAFGFCLGCEMYLLLQRARPRAR